MSAGSAADERPADERVKAEADPKTKKDKKGGPPPEEAYRAASVIFHTRGGENGAVDKLLLAVEERKVQAKYIGLQQRGSVRQRMLLFPMGRREKKDKGDSVETAKREYIEETSNFGGLAKHLNYAVFSGGEVPASDSASAPGPEADAPVEQDPRFWSGRQNMAVFLRAAEIVNLFCEVPQEAALKDNKLAVGGVSLKRIRAKEAAAEAAVEEPPAKKGKKAKVAKVSEHVPQNGKCDHLDPAWIDVDVIKKAMSSGEKAPVIKVGNEECRLFPLASSILRMSEVREWLGMKKEEAGADGDAGVDQAEGTS